RIGRAGEVAVVAAVAPEKVDVAGIEQANQIALIVGHPLGIAAASEAVLQERLLEQVDDQRPSERTLVRKDYELARPAGALSRHENRDQHRDGALVVVELERAAFALGACDHAEDVV